jgi:heavy metal sensor kinase
MLISELLLATAVAGIAIGYVRHRTLAAFDAALRGRAMSIAALVHYADEAPSGLTFSPELVPPNLELSGADLFEVISSTSALIARSNNWPGELNPSVGGSAPESIWVHGQRYRGEWLPRVPVMDEDKPASALQVSVFYAARTGGIEREFVQASTFILACTLLTLMLSVGFAVWGIRRGLLPLRSLAQHAGRVSSSNWQITIDDHDQPQELRPLTQAFLEMLGRLRDSFVQQREFLGNAAHELKTPVAILKSNAQTLLMKPRSAMEYREGLEEALEDIERLEKLVLWMLRLARAEQSAMGPSHPEVALVELADTCEEAFARVSGLARLRGISLELHRNGSAPLLADPEDLQVIWVNLLENAIRYSPEHSIVSLHVEAQDNCARVVVVDHGSGIPQEELPRSFERFQRGDPSRARATGGFGLGLALAKAFTEAYHGTIQLSSVVGKGTIVTVEFPLAQTS